MFLTAPSPDNYKAVKGSIEVMMHVLVDLESSLLVLYMYILSMLESEKREIGIDALRLL